MVTMRGARRWRILNSPDEAACSRRRYAAANSRASGGLFQSTAAFSNSPSPASTLAPGKPAAIRSRLGVSINVSAAAIVKTSAPDMSASIPSRHACATSRASTQLQRFQRRNAGSCQNEGIDLVILSPEDVGDAEGPRTRCWDSSRSSRLPHALGREQMRVACEWNAVPGPTGRPTRFRPMCGADEFQVIVLLFWKMVASGSSPGAATRWITAIGFVIRRRLPVPSLHRWSGRDR